MRRLSTLFVLGLAPWTTLAHAAETVPDKTGSTILYQVAPKTSVFNFDYGPPQSPAMKLLGLSSESTPPSTSLTKFVLSTPSLFSGDAGQAIALDFAAEALLARRQDQTSFNRYVEPNERFFRLAYRTRFNVAAMNGDAAGGDAAKTVRSRVGWGFSASLLDSADPLVTPGTKGHSLLMTCLAELTPTVNAAMAPTNQISDAYLAVAKRRHAFERAFDDVANGNFDKARDRVAPYLPGALPEDAPIATAPQVRDAAKPASADDWYKGYVTLAKSKGEFNDSVDVLAQAMRDLMKKQEGAPEKATLRAVKGPTPSVARLTDAELEVAIGAEAAKINQGQSSASEITALNAANDKALGEAFKSAGVDAGIDRCSTLASRTARYSADLDVGLGYLWRGEPGELKDLKPGGTVLWAAYKWPLGSPHFPNKKDTDRHGALLDPTMPLSAWMMSVSGRYGRSEYAPTKDKTVTEFKADIFDAWVGLEHLSETTRFAAQYGWYELDARNPVGKPFEKSGERYLATAQFRVPGLGDGTWLSLSYGNAYGSVDELDDHRALVTLVYSPPPALGITGK